MIETIYCETAVADHEISRDIFSRYPQAQVISCERYSEVFNPKTQNFRLQKRKPALILAKKHQQWVLPAPTGYGIGAAHNYYFSHILNCLYDCRYCFLQGMYRSAHYVLFVNYEDFFEEIKKIQCQHSYTPCHFFSGYDGDSLALEPITGFVHRFIDYFSELPQAVLELRTKSTQIRTLLNRPPISNCVVAFSFTPQELSQAYEHKVPTVAARIAAMLKLQQQGWPIGIRLDPLLYHEHYQSYYKTLVHSIFASLDPEKIHSVSLGLFRLPREFFKQIAQLYPEEAFFAQGNLKIQKNIISYPEQLALEMLHYCRNLLEQQVDSAKIYHCHSAGETA